MSRTLVCFDLDGTLSKQEILPKIAEVAEIPDEIAALTYATIQGVIPFDMSFKLRVRLLRETCPAKISSYLADMIEIDEYILRHIRENNDVDYMIVTGNLDCWIADLVRKIKLPCFSSLGDVRDGRLRGIKHLMRKDEPMARLRSDYATIIAVGDGENDIPLFEHADVRIAYGGVHAPAPRLADKANYIVYSSKALCELLSML
ncbi:haloacid dehalogenase [Burkholderia diffusa]|uniref:phosphoserine phosphatase n=1 Tax=Burkholderia diffusa TaxID=488732 RepID=A0AAW3P7J0_9BURK|nr:HAD-IB family phosphatase [Burkholderia diffusa]KVH43236.1 haloacid dehalogenase [Burkholderia diffusa]KVN02957.1 haloacid dehalogenase [Burkholderia diffusa]KWF41357.1 haloacid dehalogenase [Burkholderia diffusa]KWF44183.1 haloacid dehalogenase [Burkholderia diffusa]KWF45091.1 haloacid dehalogenase [Burkholderia diffusa]